MSLHELWDHCIDGRAIVQEGPTALIINSNLGYVLWSIPTSEWVRVQEGSLLWYLYTWGVSSREVCWAVVDFWGAWPPFFAITCFAFKSVMLISFGQSLMRWLGLLHPKQLFFCWYSMNALAKQVIHTTGWSIPPTLPDVLASLAAEDAVSLSPSCFALEFSSTLLLPMVAAQVVKVQLPFNLHEGKRFPDIWECVTFNTPVTKVFGGSGSLAPVLLSSFLTARSRSE